MKLINYIKDCLKDPEFKEYWLKDNLPLFENYIPENKTDEQECLTISEAIKELFESEEEYNQKLDSLMVNKGIKALSVDSSIDIEFYEKNSKCPVADFLNSIQDKKLKEKTICDIYNLNTYGIQLSKTSKSKFVRDGIFELRTQQQNNITRIFYFFFAGKKIILTNGYIKKSQQMDEEEFKKAKKYMNEYLTRK